MSGGQSLDDLKAAIESQRQRIDELSDSVKEREPSLLLAARSLYSDLRDWDGTKERFPHGSLKGLLFSWIRTQRRHFIGGGIAASVLAVIQVALLWKQNDIASRQADIMVEQTRVAAEQNSFQRAQTISFVIRELKTQDPSTNGNDALITVFGDVAFEVASGIVLNGAGLEPADPLLDDPDLNLWINSAQILGRGSNKLLREAVVPFRHKLIAQFTILQARAYEIAYQHGSFEHTAAAPSAEAGARLALKEHTQRVMIYSRRLELIKSLVTSLQTSHPAVPKDYENLTYDQKRDLLVPVIKYYQILPQGPYYPSGAYSIPSINYELGAICTSLSGKTGPFDLEAESAAATRRITESAPDLNRNFVMDSLITKWCIGLHEDTSPLVTQLFKEHPAVRATETPPPSTDRE
jgi:hypothetical protein